MSFWLVQNADIFILSRFVDHTELGIYTLASRLGFVVSFLPQGFRMGMRPLRKSAMWDAFQDQYGKQTAGGQLLAYFCLICILAVLAMVLGGQVLVDAGAAGVRRRRRADPVHGARLRHAVALPDREPERQPAEQAAAGSSAA